MNRFRNVGKILLVILVTFLFILFSPKTQAISSEEIFKRILVNNFENCYKNALRINTSFEAYRSFDSLMNDGYNLSVEVNSLNAQIWIPALNDSYNSMNNVVDTAGARVTSCYALFNGNKNSREYGLKGDMSGLFQIYNKVPPAVAYDIPVSLSALNNFMGDVLKYEIKTDGVSKTDYCYEVHLAEGGVTAGEDTIIGKYCRSGDNYPIGQYGKTSFEPYNSSYSVSGSYTQDVIYEEPDDMTGTPVGDPYFGIKVQKGDKKDCSVLVSYDPEEYKEVYCVKRVKLPLDKPTVGAVYDSFYSKEGEESWPTSDKNRIYVKITTEESTGGDSSKTTYKKDSKKWKDSLSAITNNAFSEGVAFSDANKYDFYLQYLAKYYGGGKVSVNAQSCQENKPNPLANNDEGKYYIWAKGKGWCLAKLNENAIKNSYNLTVFKNNQRYKLDKIVKNVGELIELMGELDYSNPDDFVSVEAIGEPDDPVGPDNPVPGETEITCANSAAAESLGWILCPLLNVLSNAANDIYNNTVEPMLQIQPELFSQDDNYGTKYAWDVFQNIANIIFVILFLFVIFSQLTGVGIDNYGIKKILPKLIIAAILVNLSYYICLICVDLSNIIGNGLQSMFDNLPLSADGMATSITIAGESGSQSFSIVPTAITGVALLGVLVVGIWAVIANPAILLSLLVSALGIVIAIFFLFILLSARQAAVIVLTVISPVAFVCYLLPNTKKLFDKYIQLGKGLLLLYPICGLLVGGGNYVSKLLLSSGFARDNGIAAAFTAMIIGVVPIFFIPSLLKSSFAVLGNLGAKISGFGERIRGGATRGIRNMEGYKRAQERGAEIGTRIRAGYDRNGNKRDVGRFGRFMRGVSRRGMQREALRYQKIVSDRGSLEATEGEDFMLATETANEMKNIVASGEINDMGLMQNSLRDALESGDRAKIRAYTDGLTAKGEDGRVAVKAAYNAAVGSGRMSTDSARTFANNIMANHAADYKNNNRSMFEVARNINTAANPTALSAAASTTTGSYVGANSANLAGKVTATTIGNMDDDAFGEMFGGYNGSVVTIPAGASVNEIGAAAYAALNDQNANIKAERRKYLEDLVRASGYQAKVQNVQVTGGTVDANVVNPVLNVQGTVDVGNEVDVNITQRRGGQVNPVVVTGAGGAGAPTPPVTPPTDSRSSVPQNIGGNSGADSVSE